MLLRLKSISSQRVRIRDDFDCQKFKSNVERIVYNVNTIRIL